MAEAQIRSRDIERAAAAVKDVEPSVAALVLDVLSKQAEAKLLFAGKELASKRAAEHGVANDAEVDGLRIADLLGSGPQSAREHALVCALAVKGLEAHLDEPERLSRFVRHADWLTLSTAYAPYAFVAKVLESEHAAKVWASLQSSEVRSHGAKEAAMEALHRAVLTEAGVTPLRANRGAEASVGIQGHVGRAPSGGARGIVRLVSGWAALTWLARALMWVVGVRRRATLKLVNGGVRFERTTHVLGRVSKKSAETFTLAAVASAGRTTRFPALHTLLGALALAIGIIVGGVLVVDGIRSGETVLLLLAAGFIVLGGGLDLALHVLVPAKSGTVSVGLDALPKRSIRVTRVDERAAETFLQELALRLRERAH